MKVSTTIFELPDGFNFQLGRNTGIATPDSVIKIAQDITSNQCIGWRSDELQLYGFAYRGNFFTVRKSAVERVWIECARPAKGAGWMGLMLESLDAQNRSHYSSPIFSYDFNTEAAASLAHLQDDFESLFGQTVEVHWVADC